MKKFVLFCLLAALFSFKSQAQNSGAIAVKVIDSATNEPIPNAVVVAVLNGVNQGGAVTDMEGDATIKPIKTGTYVVRVSYTGYETVQVTNVVVKADKKPTITVKLKMGSGSVNNITATEGLLRRLHFNR